MDTVQENKSFQSTGVTGTDPTRLGRCLLITLEMSLWREFTCSEKAQRALFIALEGAMSICQIEV